MPFNIYATIWAAVSIYFFYTGDILTGVAFLLLAIYQLRKLRLFLKSLSELTNIQSERNVNSYIELRFDFAKILTHDIFDDLYKKISSNTNEKMPTKDEWINNFLTNYKTKYNKEDFVERITFNIKNGLLWKNKELEFSDIIHHELYIPQVLEKEEDEGLFEGGGTTEGITIRLLVVNGILKLQLGNFSKEHSPEMLNEKGLAVYRTFSTITSFPLIYFPIDHGLPKRYLNLSLYGTQSYWDSTGGKGVDFTKDWKELNREVADYEHICNTPDDSDHLGDRKWVKIIKKFGEKKEEWLKKEKFKDPFARDDNDYYDPFYNGSTTYRNEYLVIYLYNHTENKDRSGKYFADYYQEIP